MFFPVLNRMCFAMAGLSFMVVCDLGAQELRIPAGSLVESRAGSSLVASEEAFELPAHVLGALLSTEPSIGSVTVLDFPVAPGRREPVRWEAVEVWAPGAKVHVAGPDGRTVMEPPRGGFVRGLGMESGARLAGRLVDGRLVGIAYTDDEIYDLNAFSSGDRSLQSITVSSAATDSLSQTCANADEAFNRGVLRVGPRERRRVAPSLTLGDRELGRSDQVDRTLELTRGTADKQIVIGVETDNSLWNLKGSANNLNTYIASLFQAMNVFYERDLGARLLVGDTYHWPSTGPADPYTDSTPATSALLTEVRDYWNTNRGYGPGRVFAMLLSGNSTPGYSSGIASLGSTYCGFRGYSLSQVFTNSSLSGTADAFLVGHEVGHNAGSPHTHCYSTPVDTCYSAESGCYSGSTSCPGGGKGTLMSYCHINGCGSNKLEFHPTVIGQISGQISANYPACVKPLTGPGEVFTDGFETGNANAWQ